MNVQEVLENYNSLKASIKIAKSEIRKLENEILECKSANLDGLPKPQGFASSSIENFVVDKQEKIEEKKRYIDETAENIEIIDALVKTLKRYNQEVIDMRYYKKMSIEEIAKIKNKTYDAIKITIKNSIEKMQREYNKNAKI